MQAAPLDRQLLYETAFVSGLRRNELAQLTPAHVNLENEALRLDSNWTKNRKPGLQPVPRSLLERLLAFAAAGFPDKIYRATYARSPSMNLPPKGRLLYVPAHTAAVIYRDMKRAGVDKVTPLGKLDFHALRTAYINFVLRDSTLSPTDMQDMARHGSLDMTKTVYGRARADRMRDAAARISDEICVPCAYPEDEEAERENATPVDTGGCALTKLAPALGLESKRPFFSSVQNFHKKPPNRCTSMRWASPLMTANLRSVHTVDRSTAHLSRIRGSHMGTPMLNWPKSSSRGQS